MERTFSLIIFLLIFKLVGAQSSFKSDIYKSFVNNDMDKWKSTIDEMNRKPHKSNDFLLDLINFQYGYIAWHLGNRSYDEAKKYLDLAEKNLAKLEQSNYNPSMVNSYKSAFNGFKIGLNVLKAPFLGPKSIQHADMALKLNNLNPCAYIQLGNIQFYMPSTFGGSKNQAIEYYKTAEKLMEKNAEANKYNWNYINLLIVIAQAHSKVKDYKTAQEYYEKILKIEPDFDWAKKEFETLKQKQDA